jgi:hypothetical protein
MKFCCWERRKLYSLSDLRKSVSSINEVFYSISWAHKLAGVYNPCTSEFVLSVKEGVIESALEFKHIWGNFSAKFNKPPDKLEVSFDKSFHLPN